MSELMRGFERDTLSAAWHAKRVWLTHFAMNAALLSAFYGWLLIPDRKGWQVAASLIVGLAGLILALWLHAATFQFFSGPQDSWAESWRRSARNIPGFAICAAIFIAGVWLMTYALDRQGQIGGWFHHLMPAFIRSRVSVRFATLSTHIKLDIFLFLLFPLYCFPLVREGAVRGFGAFAKGWASAARSFWHIRWWLTWIVLFLIFHIPLHLLHTKPRPGSVTEQAARMGLRLGAAYLILVTVYVLVASAVGRLRRADVSS